jgi:NAD(P)H-dependent flavin oxidoreductase YrpB (nitropropane dioxygenase family)
MQNRVTTLFGIQYPIVQAGMVWNSGWKLASASSNAGILGLIGAGSMYPEVLRTHIRNCKKATSKPFGVNIPLLYPHIEALMDIIVEEGVTIVFTSRPTSVQCPYQKLGEKINSTINRNTLDIRIPNQRCLKLVNNSIN